MWHSYGNVLILTSSVNAVLGLLVQFYVADQVQIDILKLVLVSSLMLEIGTFQCNITSAKYHYGLLVCYAVDRITNEKHTHTYRNVFVEQNENDLGGLKDLLLDVVFLFWDKILEFGIFLLANADCVYCCHLK